MEQRTGDATPLVGHLLDDRYRLDSVIARGGMATVYQATDTRLDRSVAVKVMHRALAEDPDFVRRFTREAQSSAKLSTPEVVAIHDTGKDRDTGLAYLVMEHVRGINLRQLLLERGALSPARAASLMEPVLRALGAAHSAGLVHRDVKPENVLLADDGRVKVADFGLARAVETSTMTQTTGLLIGTVAYLAPEQVESGTATARTDVYAAGVLLWELLTGSPPYSAESPMSVAYKHVHEDIPPPSTAVDGIPAALDALVVRATRRDPALRPADANEFLDELLAATGGSATVALPLDATKHQTLAIPLVVPPTVAPKPAREPRTRKRRPGLIALAVVLVLAMLAFGGSYYLGSYRYTKAPSALGLSYAAAQVKLDKAGFTVKRGPDGFDETVPKGEVLHQRPGVGKRIRKGGTITLNVSKGPDRRTVPALTGKSQSAAVAALKAVGLVVNDTVTPEYSGSISRGAVTRTIPPAGERLKPGTAVKLYVSQGPEPVAIPDVTGKSLNDADQQLKGLGFKTHVGYAFSDQFKKDQVIDQNPKGGTAAKGSLITLTVSKGPDVVEVPDVRGDSPATADGKLRQAGLNPRRFDIPGGTGSVVVSTNPGHGKKVKRGSEVDYYVI
ncbi:MAG: hypothetical protein JWO12_2280 [Frankiales bacterium]|nr:hypothetical protein [Frankiales bacterium]